MEDFTQVLVREFQVRKARNPKYSLRAFSRFLGIQSSFLSKLFSGKRTATPSMMDQLGRKLSLDEEKLESFQSSYVQKKENGELGIDFQTLELEEFQWISDWYHYAILELLRLKNFSFDAVHIARALEISEETAQKAIHRLEKLGYIQYDFPTQKWRRLIKNPTTTKNRFSHEVFRNLQAQILKKALRSLEKDPFSERDQSSLTMAIDAKKIPEAKKKIMKFRRKLMKFLEGGDSPNEVYHLSISLYPVTHLRKRSRD